MGLLGVNPIPLFLSAIAICVVFYFAMEKIRQGKSLDTDVYDIKRDIDNSKKHKQLEDKKEKLPAHAKKEPAPEVIDLGKSNNKPFSIPAHCPHTFVGGTTGSGKSVSISNYIATAIKYDYPALIVDGKGDTDEGSLLEITKQLAGVKKKLYVINLNDASGSDKYNPFRNTTATVVKDMLINLSEWSEEHYKRNTERYLQRLLDLLLINDVPITLDSIVKNTPIEKFQIQSRLANENGFIDNEKHVDNMSLAKASGKIAEEAIARFSSLTESDIGCIFADDGIDIITALREKAIILFILNPLLYPEISKDLGSLVVIDAKKAVSHLFSENSSWVYFIFDELTTYIDKSLLNLVNKARAAKASCILSSQGLSDIDELSPHFRKSIIANCNNYVFLRANSPDDAEDYANIIGTYEKMEITYQIKNDDNVTSDGGAGSLRKVRNYYYHPDAIKELKGGTAIYIDKQKGIRKKIDVNKPF